MINITGRHSFLFFLQMHAGLALIQCSALSGGCIFAFSQGIPNIYSVCRIIIFQFHLGSPGRRAKFSCSWPSFFPLTFTPLPTFQCILAFPPLGLDFLLPEKHPCILPPADATACCSASSLPALLVLTPATPFRLPPQLGFIRLGYFHLDHSRLDYPHLDLPFWINFI